MGWSWLTPQIATLIGGILTFTAGAATITASVLITRSNNKNTRQIAEDNRKHELKKIEVSDANEINKTKLLFSQQLEKEEALFKRTIKLEVVNQVQEFFEKESVFWALTHKRIVAKKYARDFPEDDFNTWLDLFINSDFSPLSSAEAKLLLIGEESAAKLIREYGNKHLEFRKKFTRNPIIADVTIAEIQKNHSELREFRHCIYKILNDPRSEVAEKLLPTVRGGKKPESSSDTGNFNLTEDN